MLAFADVVMFDLTPCSDGHTNRESSANERNVYKDHANRLLAVMLAAAPIVQVLLKNSLV